MAVDELVLHRRLEREERRTENHQADPGDGFVKPGESREPTVDADAQSD